MNNELISIVTTLYNYRRYIRDLAKSVFNQTYKNWEWIIVDDASTDNPMEVLKEYIGKGNVEYIRLPENQGYSTAKNVGIKATRGNYIVMIDADDMLTPESLELRKKALDKHPESLWCHGEALVAAIGEPLSHRSRDWKRHFRHKLERRRKWDLKKIYHHRLIHAQTVMVRPELHEIMGLYDESLRFSSDNEMWRRIIRFGYIPCHIEDFVAIYRIHSARMCQSSYKRRHVHEVKKRIIEDVERRFREGITAENTPLWIERKRRKEA